MPLKILHAVLSLDCGGLEHLVVDMCKLGRQQGDAVGVLCLERPGKLSQDLTAEGIEVHCIQKPAGRHLINTARKVRQALIATQPDVVHTHQMGALVHVGPMARQLGVRVIHTEHGRHFDGSRRKRWVARLATRFANQVACVSNDIATTFTEFRITPRGRVQTVLNGIDVAKFANANARQEIEREHSIPARSCIIGTVGRLTDVKNQQLLVRAFAEVAKISNEVRLLVVGGGELQPSLEALARQLGIQDRAHFVGYRANREAYLSAMDVFVLPSKSEGMPLAILEAWAAKVPVIASDAGGIPDIVTSGRNGVLFPSGDQPRLQEAIMEVISNCELRSRILNVGLADVSAKYAMSRMYSDYQRLYASNELAAVIP